MVSYEHAHALQPQNARSDHWLLHHKKHTRTSKTHRHTPPPLTFKRSIVAHHPILYASALALSLWPRSRLALALTGITSVADFSYVTEDDLRWGV